MLDLTVERVEHIVEAPRPRDRLPVLPPQGVGGAFDHRVENVDHAQDFPRCVTKRDRRSLRRGVVEIERPGGIGGFDSVGQEPFEEAREGSQRRQERKSQYEVEDGMEIGDRARKVGLDLNQRRPDPREERQRDCGAHKAGDNVADRDAPPARLAGPRAFEQRIERRADIRPDDQRHRRVERHDALLGE